MKIVLNKTDRGRVLLESDCITIAQDYAQDERYTVVGYSDGKHFDNYSVRETPDEIATLTSGGELPKEEVESVTSVKARADAVTKAEEKLAEAEVELAKKMSDFAEECAQKQAAVKTPEEVPVPVPVPEPETRPFAGGTPEKIAKAVVRLGVAAKKKNTK